MQINVNTRVVCLVLLIAGDVTLSSAQDRFDFFIPIEGGDSLDGTYYLPPKAPPLTDYPALIFVHGFGLNKDWDTLECLTYSRKGYLSLCYSVRGHGNSSGLSTIMSTRERSDLHQVLDYVRTLPLVDSNAVGIIGGSQGGAHALWAAADQLPVGSRFRRRHHSPLGIGHVRQWLDAPNARRPLEHTHCSV